MASPAPSTGALTSTPKPKPSTTPTPPLSHGPISILPSQFAQIYSLAHPALLLSLVTYRFNSVIENPVNELLNDIPYLVGLQVVYVMGCLPPTGGEKDGAGQEKKSQAGGAGGPRRRGKSSSSSGANWSANLVFVVWKLTPALLSLTLTALLSTPILTLLLILFGAPFTTHHVLTFLCATHMALLSAFPLIYVHGVDGSIWKEVWGAARPADAVFCGALGTCLGAWGGAVPIPLDWDRPWQAYPITILTGAYIGFCAGMLIGRVRGVFGKRIEFVPRAVTEGLEKERGHAKAE
ncbi:GPI biosynthesis protein family Pig-F-domain-containing protein [Aspergillus oleicola]